MTFIFETSKATEYWVSPSAARPYRGGNTLRYRIPIGKTIMLIDDEWVEAYTPSAETVASADRVYFGGRRYVVTEAEADDLIEAGYEDYVSEE